MSGLHFRVAVGTLALALVAGTATAQDLAEVKVTATRVVGTKPGWGSVSGIRVHRQSGRNARRPLEIKQWARCTRWLQRRKSAAVNNRSDAR